jgi:hypothetical protein
MESKPGQKYITFVIPIKNQLDAKISQVYYLTFMYSSTCFGRPHAHHQELKNCSSNLWFYRWSVVIAVLLVVVGPVETRPRPTALLSPRSKGKTKGCYCSCWTLDDGRENARNMLSCTQTSSKKLEKIVASSWLIYWNCMMIHGLANFQFTSVTWPWRVFYWKT